MPGNEDMPLSVDDDSVTQKIVDLAPDALEPVLEPVLTTAETGAKKAAKMTVETCRAIGSFLATATGVLLTGETENPFEGMFKKNRHSRTNH